MDTPRTTGQPPSTTTDRTSRPARLTALDEWLDRGFYWISENSVWTIGVLGTVIVVGGIAAGVHEYRGSRESAAQSALAEVDRELEAAFRPGSEPANADTAKELREKAVAGYDAVIRDHSGRFGAELATIHAASLEIDLEHFDAAEKRLGAAIAAWPKDAVQRAVALRLRGYALERTDRAADAAESYAQAAGISDYPGRAGAYVQAGDTFARIGQNDRAIQAYEALTLLDPGFAERYGVLERLQALRATAAPKPPGDPAPAPPPKAEKPAS